MSKDWDIAAGLRKTVSTPKKRTPAPTRNETDEQRARRRLVTDFQRVVSKKQLRGLYDALPKKITEHVRLASWATRRPDLIAVARRPNSFGAVFQVPDGWPEGVDKDEAVRDFIAEHFPRPEGIEKSPDEDAWFSEGGHE
jgi:hypothetical protein